MASKAEMALGCAQCGARHTLMPGATPLWTLMRLSLNKAGLPHQDGHTFCTKECVIDWLTAAHAHGAGDGE